MATDDSYDLSANVTVQHALDCRVRYFRLKNPETSVQGEIAEWLTTIAPTTFKAVGIVPTGPGLFAVILIYAHA